LEKSERATAANGDTVSIDFEGFLNGEPVEGAKGQGYRLELGSKSFIPGFEEQLVGKKVGTNCELEVTFPADYHAENLKNQKVLFKVAVNEVLERKNPVLDAEFYKKISPVESQSAFQDFLKNEMAKDYSRQAEEQLEKSLKEQVLAENPGIPVPESMKNRQKEFLRKQAQEQLKGQGYNKFLVDDLLKYSEASISKDAEDLVKLFLAFRKVIDDQKLEVSDAEIDAQVGELAKQYNAPVEEVRQHYANLEQKNELKGFILEKKVIQHLLGQSKVNTKKVSISEFEELKKSQGKKAEA